MWLVERRKNVKAEKEMERESEAEPWNKAVSTFRFRNTQSGDSWRGIRNGSRALRAGVETTRTGNEDFARFSEVLDSIVETGEQREHKQRCKKKISNSGGRTT